ncbi:MAG: hypothetical protein ABSB29_00350 [Nitrososphaerales archaeon]
MEAPKEENMKSVRKKAGLVIFSVLAVSSLTLWFLAVADHFRLFFLPSNPLISPLMRGDAGTATTAILSMLIFMGSVFVLRAGKGLLVAVFDAFFVGSLLVFMYELYVVLDWTYWFYGRFTILTGPGSEIYGGGLTNQVVAELSLGLIILYLSYHLINHIRRDQISYRKLFASAFLLLCFSAVFAVLAFYSPIKAISTTPVCPGGGGNGALDIVFTPLACRNVLVVSDIFPFWMYQAFGELSEALIVCAIVVPLVALTRKTLVSVFSLLSLSAFLASAILYIPQDAKGSTPLIRGAAILVTGRGIGPNHWIGLFGLSCLVIAVASFGVYRFFDVGLRAVFESLTLIVVPAMIALEFLPVLPVDMPAGILVLVVSYFLTTFGIYSVEKSALKP